jgi:hypothetical protein
MVPPQEASSSTGMRRADDDTRVRLGFDVIYITLVE